jgi:mono/diheme cytochrome c family protein
MTLWTIASLVTASTLVVAAHALAQPAPSDPLQLGRELARATCGACHLVAKGGQDKPILDPPAPNLLLVTRRPVFSEDALRKRLSSGHGQSSPKGAAPHPKLNEAQIDQVASYIMSLRSAE